MEFHYIAQNLRNMKRTFRKICRWALGLMGISCAASCDEINNQMAEYGCPYAQFEIKGKVTDPEGNPIKGIEVSSDFIGESTYTKEDGTYLYKGGFFPGDTMPLSMKDVDGEENGGKFKEFSKEIRLKHEEEGSGNWDFGKYTADVNAILDRE